MSNRTVSLRLQKSSSALGGPSKLGRALGIDKRTVSGWRKTTIPPRYRDVMVEMLFDVKACAPASLWGMVEPKTADTEAA
jgi:hypothetical protein